MDCQAIVLAILVLWCGTGERPAVPVEEGIVKEITKDGFTIIKKDGKPFRLKPNDNLKKGIDDTKEKVFNAKLKELRVAQWVSVCYKLDEKTSDWSCTRFRILKQPDRPGGLFEEGTVKQITKESFTIVNNDRRTFILKPNDNLKMGIDDGKEKRFKDKLTSLKVGQVVNIKYKIDPKTYELICTHLDIIRQPKNSK